MMCLNMRLACLLVGLSIVAGCANNEAKYTELDKVAGDYNSALDLYAHHLAEWKDASKNLAAEGASKVDPEADLANLRYQLESEKEDRERRMEALRKAQRRAEESQKALEIVLTRLKAMPAFDDRYRFGKVLETPPKHPMTRYLVKRSAE